MVYLEEIHAELWTGSILEAYKHLDLFADSGSSS
jgi:hypothetical protein